LSVFFSDAKYLCLDVQDISVGSADKVLMRLASPLFLWTILRFLS